MRQNEFKYQVLHREETITSMDVWRPVGLDGNKTRSANEENPSSQETQILHVLGNTIIVVFVSFCCRAALAGRDDNRSASQSSASECGPVYLECRLEDTDQW